MVYFLNKTSKLCLCFLQHNFCRILIMNHTLNSMITYLSAITPDSNRTLRLTLKAMVDVQWSFITRRATINTKLLMSTNRHVFANGRPCPAFSGTFVCFVCLNYIILSLLCLVLQQSDNISNTWSLYIKYSGRILYETKGLVLLTV